MCNAKMLMLFIQMCNFFLNANPQSVGLSNCIKAFDVCVDRQYWTLEEAIIKPINPDDAVVDICEDELFNRKLFSEYYSDNRCEQRNNQYQNFLKNR
jgi:hypothetical protein